MTRLPWRLPAGCALAAAVIVVADANQTLFLAVNAAGGAFAPGFLMAVTLLGNVLAGVALIAPALQKQPRLLWAALLAAVPATLFVQGGKHLFAWPRPAAVLPPDSLQLVGPLLKAMSFPSGHTATAFVFAAVIVGLTHDRRWQAAALVVAIAVGLSRMLVGAHWPIDVLAGAGGGWLCGGLGVVWCRRLAWPDGRAAALAAGLLSLAAAVGLLLAEYALPAERAFGYVLALPASYASWRLLRRYAAGQ
jgi:membrane-associated phospholipid phosphatase